VNHTAAESAHAPRSNGTAVRNGPAGQRARSAAVDPARSQHSGEDHVRILVAIANHGTRNLHHLERLLEVYRAYSHQVDVVVLSNVPKDVGEDIEVRVGLPTRDPWSLPFGHRQLFAERADAYDYFIYSEDDTELPQASFEAYRTASGLLPPDKIAGFLRYEVADDGTVFCCTAHGPYHWVPQSVFRVGDHVFARYTNDHGACYVLSQAQLKACIASGGFLVHPHRGRYDMLCSAATDPYTRCGFEKVVPISHFDVFCLRHLSDRYQGTIGVEMEEFKQQVDRLLSIPQEVPQAAPWLSTELRLPVAEFDKKFFEPANEEILAALPGSGLRILSVGCGRGLTEGDLTSHGHSVTAVPIDAVIAESARLRGVELLSPDPDRAVDELGEREFDVILFNGVLNYVASPVALLRRFRRNLASEGQVMIAFTNFAHLALLVRRMRGDRAARLLGASRPFERFGMHPAARREIAAWLRAADLVPGHVSYTTQRKRDRQLLRLSLGLLAGRLGRRGLITATAVDTASDRRAKLSAGRRPQAAEASAGMAMSRQDLAQRWQLAQWRSS
jgi:2-polyprenyl-3-methyl-5-hydroxy-6-metoxy-1,4-benzoquinol methylase